jgi:hypothetical protein
MQFQFSFSRGRKPPLIFMVRTGMQHQFTKYWRVSGAEQDGHDLITVSVSAYLKVLKIPGPFSKFLK